MSMGVDPAQVWELLRNNWWRIVTLTLGGAALGLAVALALPPVYVSQSTILPSENQAQSTSLGALFGLLIPRTTSPAQIIALARSRRLASDVIKDMDLKPILFAEQWDGRLNAWRPTWRDRLARWRGVSANPQPPSDSIAVRRFRRAIRISANKNSGIITIRARWRDARQAASWVDAIVERLDNTLRSRAQDNGRFLIENYRASLQANSPDGLADNALGQVAIKRLIEATIADVARAAKDPAYSFEVIDPASVDDRPEQPRPLLTAALGGALGLAFGLGVVVVAGGNSDRSQRPISNVPEDLA